MKRTKSRPPLSSGGRPALILFSAVGVALVACGWTGEGDAAGGSAASAGADEASRDVPDPARIIEELRPRVPIAGRPDSGFSLADRMEHYHVPGVSLAVVADHRIVWARGFGTRTFGAGEPVDTTTLFLAGSISKPVFATGTLRLVEAGQLALDTDINRSLESWKLPGTRFTTAPDLARWAISVSRSYSGEDGVLRRETAREMLTRQVELEEDGGTGEAAWGLGPAITGSDTPLVAVRAEEAAGE